MNHMELKKMSKLYIAGIGPGAKEYITPASKIAVKKSDIVVGSQRAVDLYPEAKEKIILNVKDLQEKMELAVREVVSGKNVTLLSTGDPGFSGMLKPILKIFKDRNLDENLIEVIPGISSLQLAAAKMKVPWDDANIMTFHGRENIEDILPIVNNGKVTIALPSRSAKDMAQFLMDNGLEEDRKIAVCERLSYEDERIVVSTLKDISNSEFTYMCVLVIY